MNLLVLLLCCVSQQYKYMRLTSLCPARSGIKELVATLHAQGKTVYLVSGGFRQIIEPVAEILNIPKSNIFANQILYKVGLSRCAVASLDPHPGPHPNSTCVYNKHPGICILLNLEHLVAARMTFTDSHATSPALKSCLVCKLSVPGFHASFGHGL